MTKELPAGNQTEGSEAKLRLRCASRNLASEGGEDEWSRATPSEVGEDMRAPASCLVEQRPYSSARIRNRQAAYLMRLPGRLGLLLTGGRELLLPDP